MRQLFINLPVKDVDAAMLFYTQLGFTVNPLFTFDDQKCMVWSDQIYVMLQTVDMFKSGNTKNLADPKQNTIASFTLPVESLDRLNQIIDLEDPDGHQWGILYLDLEKFKKMKGK